MVDWAEHSPPPPRTGPLTHYFSKKSLLKNKRGPQNLTTCFIAENSPHVLLLKIFSNKTSGKNVTTCFKKKIYHTFYYWKFSAIKRVVIIHHTFYCWNPSDGSRTFLYQLFSQPLFTDFLKILGFNPILLFNIRFVYWGQFWRLWAHIKVIIIFFSEIFKKETK